MYVLLFSCFIAILQAVNGNYAPICQPKSSSKVGPKLPTFPSSFSTSVEVNIANKNYTALFKEFYDLEANKGSLQRTKDGKTHRRIYDYNLDEKIFIDLDAKNCSVSSINGSRFNFFGNNNSHIESAAQLFRFAKQYNETYIGVTSVRGITCNHWRACIVHSYSSYYLDYYFSVPGWKTTWQDSTVVRAVINGTRSARTHGGVPHDFYHVYDFFNFHPGPPDPSNFQLPGGYYCTGLKGENKTVPKVPSVFSMELETVWSGNRSNQTLYVVTSWKETYDFEKKVVLMKHPNWHNPNVGPVLEIFDFNTGIHYNISTGKSGTECKTTILTAKDWLGAKDGNHHIRLKTTQELFSTPQRNGSTPLVYKGSASVRGVAADIWVGKSIVDRKNKSYEVVIEWYFSKPNWRFKSGSQDNEHQVPVRLDWYWAQRSHLMMNLFNFDAEAAEITAFDIKPCFRWEEQRFIQFSLDGKYDEYGGSREFLLSVTKAISRAANVSIIRVNGIRVYSGVQNSKEGIVVTFVLLNKTKTVGGKVEVTVYPEKDLMAALDALKNSVQSGKFMVEFQKKKIYAAKSSFFVGLRPTNAEPSGATAKPSSQPNPGGKSKVKTKGVSSGTAAGISFLMLAVGICGGLVIAHFIMKRRGTSLFSYQRQE